MDTVGISIHRLKWEWDLLTTFNQFVASFVHLFHSKNVRSIVKQQEKILTDEVVRDFRLSGDAHYNNYAFDQALQAYQRALGYVAKQQTPQLRAAIIFDIGKTHTELGNRT